MIEDADLASGQDRMSHLCASPRGSGQRLSAACLLVSQFIMVDPELMQPGDVQLRHTHSIVYGLIASASSVAPWPYPPLCQEQWAGNSVLESVRCQLKLSCHGTAEFVVELFDVKSAGHTKRSALRLG